jgi:hypothetical protein
MKRISVVFCASLLLCGAWLSVVNAAIIPFDLQGTAGFGLIPGNENPATTGGSGGEIGAGITFDDVSLQLTINIGWGSGNGFTDLTGIATGGHIHGITDNPAPGSFTENKPVLIALDTLAGWNPSATNGSFTGIVTLTAPQAAALQEGRLYINIHTDAHTGGEIRGYLVVPEPSSLALLMVVGAGISAFAVYRRKRTKNS